MRANDNDIQLFTMTQTPHQGDPIATGSLSDFPDLSHRRSRHPDTISDDITESGCIVMRRPPASASKTSPTRRRSAKLSFSALKRSSFLRGLSRGRRRNRSESENSNASSNASPSQIPPLRERLSTTSVLTPKRKRRRKTNELYSPWLRNSRFHFLKKYRISAESRKPRASMPPPGRSDFSPGWSRVKRISAEFGQNSKGQLIIKSSSRRRPSRAGNFRRNVAANDPASAAAAAGPVCRFLMPLGRLGDSRGGENGEATRIVCNNCGQFLTLFPPPETTPLQQPPTTASKKRPMSMPPPCPMVHAEEAYWPEVGRDLPSPPANKLTKLEVSPAPTSVVTIQPSFIPQSFSVNTVQQPTNQPAPSENTEVILCLKIVYLLESAFALS